MFTLSDLSDLSGWRVIKAIAEVRPNNMDALLFAILGGTVPWLGFFWLWGYGVAMGGPWWPQKKIFSDPPISHEFCNIFTDLFAQCENNVRKWTLSNLI